MGGRVTTNTGEVVTLEWSMLGEPQYETSSTTYSTLTFYGESADYVAHVLRAARHEREERERRHKLDALISNAAIELGGERSLVALESVLRRFADEVQQVTAA